DYYCYSTDSSDNYGLF
nr:immunoglobulin light chain junction region [Macaca mulatta]MOX43064.1 immunoglobulin light chain junction region [Macaca mulatta]MOX45027.1 immunoglobulin light chain junction region [Macaca mulatta]MOX45585.1 immunoglobulin light chain junction region [Macaca mulatta]MOX45837.1 immunoglobulin light chain junction region [Macaca mulatta]